MFSLSRTCRAYQVGSDGHTNLSCCDTGVLLHSGALSFGSGCAHRARTSRPRRARVYPRGGAAHTAARRRVLLLWGTAPPHGPRHSRPHAPRAPRGPHGYTRPPDARRGQLGHGPRTRRRRCHLPNVRLKVAGSWKKGHTDTQTHLTVTRHTRTNPKREGGRSRFPRSQHAGSLHAPRSLSPSSDLSGSAFLPLAGSLPPLPSLPPPSPALALSVHQRERERSVLVHEVHVCALLHSGRCVGTNDVGV